LAICIRTGDIVWACGGVSCGEWPDLRLARDAIIFNLKQEEKTIADWGYNKFKNIYYTFIQHYTIITINKYIKNK